jgi:hypothetical protein
MDQVHADTAQGDAAYELSASERRIEEMRDKIATRWGAGTGSEEWMER